MNPVIGRLGVVTVLQVIALYKTKGIVHAIAYLIQFGWTVDEATDLLALYDDYEVLAEAGRL